MFEADGLERAIGGALRGAIYDHGPITAHEIGSATKRIVGNLKNARRQPLSAGEHRTTLVLAILCCCARCSHEWVVIGKEPGRQPFLPERCANRECHKSTWDQEIPRKPGRPKKDLKPQMSGS